MQTVLDPNAHPLEVPIVWSQKLSRTAITSLSITVLLIAGPASAHDGTGLAGGFSAGFLHPLAGFDHMLAMVAVGLWGAFLGRPLVAALPVIFPSLMAFGALLGMAGASLPPVEIGIALSVLLLGLAITFRLKPPTWAACLVVAMFGLFHGYAHGLELPSAADPVGYSAGFVLSTGLLHVCGIALGVLKEYRLGARIMTGTGGLIAASGAFFIVQAVGS
ncbi:HupE/UreJ family protein [Caulobacter sp. ErkDOM-YI]|uniref:HupE/UreJ family protein n=1 Tax=unclassified Caulobacter TaxID=2648921 RepID=UPI003AF5332F